MEQDPLEKLSLYLDRAIDPKTEEDYFLALNFWVDNIMTCATSRCRGKTDFGNQLNETEVEKELTLKLLAPIPPLVDQICQLFSVAHPDSEKKEGQILFTEWYEKHRILTGRRDSYPGQVLSKIKKGS